VEFEIIATHAVTLPEPKCACIRATLIGESGTISGGPNIIDEFTSLPLVYHVS
jgi:hypothetical protein